jgi:hypothetical protein
MRPVVIVVALALVAMGCESDKPAAPPVAPGGDFVPTEDKKPTADAEKDTAGAKAEFKGAGAVLVKPDALGDAYKLEQGPEYYTKDNLFEVIDGGSESYIAYGVTQMAKAVYKAQGGEYTDEINVEIYEFGPKLAAFGKFALERSGCKASETRANWCLRDGDLIFWKGHKLVKVGAFDNTKAALAAIDFFAAKVDAAITDKADLPAFFARFPKENRVAGGGGWSPRDQYGIQGLKNVYLHTYRPPGEKYAAEGSVVTLFAMEPADGEAKALFEKFKSTVTTAAKDKKSIVSLDGVGEGAFIYSDGYGTHSVILKGKTLAGGRDFQDDETAKSMTTALGGTL